MICGIIGCKIKSSRQLRKTLWKIYRYQKARGQQGAGVSILRKTPSDTDRVRRRRVKDVIKHKLIDSIQPGDFLLFHHRLPTSTPNIDRCNHPICSETGSIHLAHNGWVSGADYHYKRLKGKGHRFETEILQVSSARLGFHYYGTGEVNNFTDSEVIVHELEDNLDHSDIIQAIETTVENLYGSLTFAFFMKGVPSIYLYRGSNPCSVYKDKAGNVWFSSEYPKHRGFKLIRHMVAGEIGVIDESGFRSLKMCQTFETLESFVWKNDVVTNGFENDFKREKQDIVYDVMDFVQCSSHYIRHGISVAEIADMLRSEFESSGIKSNDRYIYELASDIWDGL